jgi:hypothetical protein
VVEQLARSPGGNCGSIFAQIVVATAQQHYIGQVGPQTLATRAWRGLDRYFYFFMSLLFVAVIAYGFSFTIDKNLIHPAVPRPWILYVHAFVFPGWLVFFILQSTLVRSRKVQWHRRLGWFGVALGTLIPIVGVSTAIVMGRFNTASLHATHTESDLIIPLFDMLCFTCTFPLAVYWRKKPETHRRLMLVATCALTAAGFGRFPERILPPYLFYAGVDLLILLGVVRDLSINRSIHRVYLFVLPLFILGQAIVTYIGFHNVPFWLRIAHTLLG